MNPSPHLGSLARDTDSSKNVRRFPAWIVPAAIIAGFGLLFLAMFRGRLLPAPDVKVAVVLATPQDSPVSQTPTHAGAVVFQASGWIEPDPLAVKATALIDGVVETVAVLEGQLVEKGALLANLIDADTRLALAAAEKKFQTLTAARAAHLASISSAEKRFDAARAQFVAAATLRDEAADQANRFDGLASNAVPVGEVVSAKLRLSRETALAQASEATSLEFQSEIRRLELETQMKDHEIATAAIEVEQAKLALSRTRIVSPITGRVLRLHAVPGQKKMLQDNDPESSTIAILYEPAKLQVRVDVPLADAAGLAVGQGVKIRSSFLPDRVFQGEVSRITGEADLQRNTLQAKVRILDPIDQLRPEMLCRAEFLGNTGPVAHASSLATWIPESALTDGAVWRCDPESKIVSKQPVVVASEVRGGHIRIDQGLRPGEWIVLSPGSLRNGQRVNPIPTQTHE